MTAKRPSLRSTAWFDTTDRWNSRTGRVWARARPRWRTDLMPSGRFLMKKFCCAGGLPAVLRRMGEAGLLPHPDALTAKGHSLWDNVKVLRWAR